MHPWKKKARAVVAAKQHRLLPTEVRVGDVVSFFDKSGSEQHEQVVAVGHKLVKTLTLTRSTLTVCDVQRDRVCTVTRYATIATTLRKLRDRKARANKYGYRETKTARRLRLAARAELETLEQGEGNA